MLRMLGIVNIALNNSASSANGPAVLTLTNTNTLTPKYSPTSKTHTSQILTLTNTLTTQTQEHVGRET